MTCLSRHLCLLHVDIQMKGLDLAIAKESEIQVNS